MYVSSLSVLVLVVNRSSRTSEKTCPALPDSDWVQPPPELSSGEQFYRARARVLIHALAMYENGKDGKEVCLWHMHVETGTSSVPVDGRCNVGPRIHVRTTTDTQQYSTSARDSIDCSCLVARGSWLDRVCVDVRMCA